MNRFALAIYGAAIHAALAPVRAAGAAKSRFVSWQSAPRPVPSDGRILFPGKYALTADYFPDRTAAIRVYCDDVSIDLKGFSLGVGAKGSTSFGVWALGVQRLRVFGGTVTHCDIGVKGNKSNDVTVERVNFDGVHFMGIDCTNRGLVVRNCTFSNIEGFQGEAYAIGVNAPGDDALIEGCYFRNLDRQPNASADQQGEGVGIVVSGGNRNCCIIRNRFENEPTENPVSIGIFVAKDGEARILDNTMINIPHAVGAQAAVTVAGNLFAMRYYVTTAIAVHVTPGSIVERNIFIGYTQPDLTGITARNNQLLTEVVTAMPGDEKGGDNG